MAELKDAKRYRFNGESPLNLNKVDTDGGIDKEEKDAIIAKTKELNEKIQAMQEKLYADGREGVILVLQAMDAAGKDSTIKHVMSGVNPQGVDVHSFKTPNSAELAHDFLWRVNSCIPERGKIAIFNRSYYEDVLVVKLREMNKTYKMPERCTGKETEAFFKERYEDITNYEKYLFHNGYRVIKIFLNVSKKEQKKRFLERIDEADKNWKFSASDLTDRADWDAYHEIYQDAINATATPIAPWYVLPADKKWYTRYLVSEILLKTLEDIDPQFPVLDEAARMQLADCRKQLEEEDGGKEKKADKKDKAEKSDKADKKDKAEKSDKADKKDKAGKSDKADKSEKADKKDKAEKKEKKDKKE